MGRLPIVEEEEAESDPTTMNNNSAADVAPGGGGVDQAENKRKAGNSDESGYLSEKRDSDDGSVEIVFERKGADKNGNGDALGQVFCSNFILSGKMRRGTTHTGICLDNVNLRIGPPCLFFSLSKMYLTFCLGIVRVTVSQRPSLKKILGVYVY